MKITILGVNTGVNEEQKQAFDEGLLSRYHVRLSDEFEAADPKYKLLIQPEAVREIFDFTEWDVGVRLDTRMEQGGILLGNRFYDEEKDIHYAVVSKVITADTAKGSSAFLEITQECWRVMHEKKDAYIEATGNQVIIVGWFHTHPNTLPVFMSGTDRNTQNLFFNGENTYSVVMNPQQHWVKAFRSAECYLAQAMFLLDHPKPVEDTEEVKKAEELEKAEEPETAEERGEDGGTDHAEIWEFHGQNEGIHGKHDE